MYLFFKHRTQISSAALFVITLMIYYRYIPGIQLPGRFWYTPLRNAQNILNTTVTAEFWRHGRHEEGFSSVPFRACSHETRTKRMRAVCSSKNHTIKGNPPWNNPHKTRRILVDDTHRVLYCVIPKVGCSTWKHLMVNLTGKQNQGKLQLHGYYINKYGLYYLSTYKPEERRRRLKTYMKFIVTRHPFDRLVSAYQDKFVNVQHRPDIIKRIKKASNKSMDGTKIVDFKEFVQFVATQYHNHGKDKHWERYEDLCYPCEIDYDYIAKLETATEDARIILRNMTGKSHEKFKLPRANARRSISGFTNILREFSTVPKDTADKLNKLYKNDLDIFGYSFNIDSKVATCEITNNEGLSCC